MRINVKVIPKSSKEEVAADGESLKVYVKAAPDKGKANKAVIELVAGHYGVKRSGVRIVCGETSRNKIVEVSGR
ncbi:MAG: DUF167 domain-containing protein [Candidatus Omnitrophica bacterium]|nr:DUF167 domain-containing protein [Candidatus Omnitrophota bacterium]MDD4012744.1 DUF167 domain-containing protein [Candidatus Omnitrophota bacterium]